MLVGVPCKGKVVTGKGGVLDTLLLYLLLLASCSILIPGSEGRPRASSSSSESDEDSYSDESGVDSSEESQNLFHRKFREPFGLSSSSFEDLYHYDTIEFSKEDLSPEDQYSNLFPVPLKVKSNYETSNYPSTNTIHNPKYDQLETDRNALALVPEAHPLKSEQKASSGYYTRGDKKRSKFGDYSSSKKYKPKGQVGEKKKDVITVQNPQNELTDDEIVEMLRSGGYDLSKTELRVVDKSGERIIKGTSGNPGWGQNTLFPRHPWDRRPSTTTSTPSPLKRGYMQPQKETEKYTDEYPDSYVYVGSHNQLFPDLDSYER